MSGAMRAHNARLGHYRGHKSEHCALQRDVAMPGAQHTHIEYVARLKLTSSEYMCTCRRLRYIALQ
jgi:predicted SprT family Zn-dependent metalloprotease